ncbi:nucleotidyltransferase domain-containing protein [Candidatus Micrarchaeota archaeon]|nr:nucleotidyltransferase domain-containing protein [Candidatus Micrarchaeota archaeon]
MSKSHIKRAYLFGSFARGQKKYNDIDIAIDPPKGFTLLDLSRIANSIEDQTGRNIDLVTIRAMNPKIKNAIKKEMVAI